MMETVSNELFLQRHIALTERQSMLIDTYSLLPEYGSMAFWKVIEGTDIPLETLVRCFRLASLYEDHTGRDRLFTVIVLRTQTINAAWAKAVLKTLPIVEDVRIALASDLCADLYECVLRALLDQKKRFWEEHFLHCLRFERQHVYKACMMREGYWQEPQVKRSMRVPRSLLTRIDVPIQTSEEMPYTLDIEDKQAQSALLAMEQTDMLLLIQGLPTKLKIVLLLLFWEGRPEKEVAQVLGVTDRTVRNRKREALALLRQAIENEGVLAHGTKA